MTRFWPPAALLYLTAGHVIRLLLRSPLHPLFSRRFMLLTYESPGRGHRRQLPMPYHQWNPDEIWLFIVRAVESAFEEPQTVRLVLRGRELTAETSLVEDRAEVARLLVEHARRHGPIKEGFLNYLGIPRDRVPTPEEALAAADRTRIARFRLLVESTDE